MLINYFLILEVLLLFSGLALDAGLLQWKTLQLQSAADAAAQESMYELARNNSAWSSAGQAQSTKNGFANGTNGVSVTLANPPTSGPYSGDTSAVQATVSEPATNLFMELVGAGQASLTRSAVARVLPTCIWIMNPNGTTQSTLRLSSASLHPSCGVYVNATNMNLGVDLFSNIYSTRLRVVGPSSQSNSSGTISPQAKFGAAAKNDPLAYLTAPVFSGCTYSNLVTPPGTYYVSAGTYCNCNLSNSTVIFSPGLYMIVGAFTLANSVISGPGVTFYLTKGGTYSYGAFTLSNVTSTISAPTSTAGGGIPGILCFADRGFVAHGSQNIQISGSTLSGDGIWYAANTGISISSSSFKGTNYMGLVVDNLYQYQGTTFGSANYSTLPGGSPFHYEDGVLVQ